MEGYLLILLGSALGGVGRYWCSNAIARRFGGTFPWGTLAVNVVGSFVIGFFDALAVPDGRLLGVTPARQFVMVGICGGYTTFSSFSLQTLNLIRDGEMVKAAANVAGSVITCLLAVWLGYVAGAAVRQAKWM